MTQNAVANIRSVVTIQYESTWPPAVLLGLHAPGSEQVKINILNPLVTPLCRRDSFYVDMADSVRKKQEVYE